MSERDIGREQTDKLLEELEKRIFAAFSEANAEMQKLIDDYFESLKRLDAKNREWMTEEEYKQWRLNAIGRGERFIALRDKLAERMADAHEVAIAYVNDATPGIYSLNRNYAAYTIEKAYGNLDFTFWDEATVRRLIVEQPNLMPYYPEEMAVKRGIDLKYGQQQITAQVTSGILRGLSIQSMARELMQRVKGMEKVSAVRAARTATTSAENGGRQDSYERAAQMGIRVRKRWVATKDERTRKNHQDTDGQPRDWDQPFDVGGAAMMFPGDRNGPAKQVYNCRCSMRTIEKEGIEAEPRMMRVRDASGRNVLVSEMTYHEWEEWKKNES